MNNITRAFAHGKALIPFFTCGDPDLETTARAIQAAVENGADLIELGIPFSDPTTESPAIQGSNLRARRGGVTTDVVFAFVRELRRELTLPILFRTYANVVFSYGTERFMAACREAGVDGLVVLDLPLEEREEFQPVCTRYGVCLLSLVAPTSGGRVAKIARQAEGFLYLTAPQALAGDLPPVTAEIRAHTSLPCTIGCGIATPEQAKNMGALADGIIVGSAIAKLLAEHGREAPARIGAYVRSMKEALASGI